MIKSLQTVTNKPYVNEVTLRGQKPPLKCCWPLDFWCAFLQDLDSSNEKNLGSVSQRAAKLPAIKL